MQALGELVVPIARGMTRVDGQPLRNVFGIVVACVRRGVVAPTVSGVVFALCCARRAARQARDPAGLFWFLLRHPERCYAIDNEWPGARAELAAAGRTVEDLLSVARSGRTLATVMLERDRQHADDAAMRARHHRMDGAR